jgi:hypothetical protein
MLDLIRNVIPPEIHRLDELRERRRTLAETYDEIEPWNFSKRVLERIPHELVVVPVEGLRWSDWGTRASIERTLIALDRRTPWSNHKAPKAAATNRGATGSPVLDRESLALQWCGEGQRRR